MYPYHNMIKKRINNGELVDFSYADSHNKIEEPVLLLHFATEPKVKPIRKPKWDQYETILKEKGWID